MKIEKTKESLSRQFDLSKFDERYWTRFREQCVYLQSKGIIIDLLMWNGWRLSNYNEEVAAQDWDGHFFNPINNINACTDILSTASNKTQRLKIYRSVSDGNERLLAIQKAYFEKIIEVKHDLDNIYYELVHEIAINYEDWDKTSSWIEERSIILAIDGAIWRVFLLTRGVAFQHQDQKWIGYFRAPTLMC